MPCCAPPTRRFSTSPLSCKGNAMPADRSYCTFYLDDIFFGVEVEKVQEVVCYQEMTRVPLAPPGVRGLINLRGQIVTALDLRRRLELPERPAGRNPDDVEVRVGHQHPRLLVATLGGPQGASMDS